MLEQNSASFNPEHLLQLKSELLARWQHLPSAHRASMALVLLQDVLAGDYGPWLIDALLLQEGRIQQTVETALLGEEVTESAQPGSELLDPATLEQLPLTFTAEGEKKDALAYARLVLPGDSRVWYVSAYDRHDLCFGLIVETDITFDYFNLSELRALTGADGQGIRRDPGYEPRSLSDLQALYERRQLPGGL